MSMAVAHHRFNYIHPFPDGNGRVSRLMSHAMAWRAEVASHGLWSISRGQGTRVTPVSGAHTRDVVPQTLPARLSRDLDGVA